MLCRKIKSISNEDKFNAIKSTIIRITEYNIENTDINKSSADAYEAINLILSDKGIESDTSYSLVSYFMEMLFTDEDERVFFEHNDYYQLVSMALEYRSK